MECRIAFTPFRLYLQGLDGLGCAFNHNMAKTAMIWLNASTAMIWLKNRKRVNPSISMG
jgi:hypothetical protein